MGFLDDIKRKEQDKQQQRQDIHNRIPAWIQAVRQLNKFIEQHLGPVTSGQQPLVKIRENKIRFDRLECTALAVTYDGKTAIFNPLDLTDQETKDAAGRVTINAESGFTYDLIWDGKAEVVIGHWQIKKVAGGTKSTIGDLFDLTGETLDDALARLFGTVLEG